MDVKEEPIDCKFYYTVDTNLCQLPNEKRNTNINYVSDTQQIDDGIQESNDYMLMNIKSEELDIKDEMLTEPDDKDEDYADVSPVTKKIECDIYNPSHKHHLKTRAGRKPYACNICEYRASHKYILVAHLKTHTGEKPYACNICEYRALRKSHLAAHLLTHSGEKPYACNRCKYRASQQSYLASHLLTHSGKTKNYACNICKHRTSCKKSLKFHMQTHIEKKPYTCNICEYRTLHSYNLASHLVKYHSEKKPCTLVIEKN